LDDVVTMDCAPSDMMESGGDEGSDKSAERDGRDKGDGKRDPPAGNPDSQGSKSGGDRDGDDKKGSAGQQQANVVANTTVRLADMSASQLVEYLLGTLGVSPELHQARNALAQHFQYNHISGATMVRYLASLHERVQLATFFDTVTRLYEIGHSVTSAKHAALDLVIGEYLQRCGVPVALCSAAAASLFRHCPDNVRSLVPDRETTLRERKRWRRRRINAQSAGRHVLMPRLWSLDSAPLVSALSGPTVGVSESSSAVAAGTDSQPLSSSSPSPPSPENVLRDMEACLLEITTLTLDGDLEDQGVREDVVFRLDL